MIEGAQRIFNGALGLALLAICALACQRREDASAQHHVDYGAASGTPAPSTSMRPVASATPGACEETCRRVRILDARERRLCGTQSRRDMLSDFWFTPACESAERAERNPSYCNCEVVPPPWHDLQGPPVETPECVAHCGQIRELFVKYIKFCQTAVPGGKDYNSPRCDAVEEKVFSVSREQLTACGCEFPSPSGSEWMKNSFDD